MRLFQSIKSRLIVMGTGVVAFAILVLGVTTHSVVHRYVLASHREAAKIKCLYQAEKVAARHRQVKATLQQIAHSSPVETCANPSRTPALADYLASFHSFLPVMAFLDEEGLEDFRVINGQPTESAINWKDRPLHQAARAHANTVVYQVVLPTSPEGPTLVRYLIVNRGGEERFQGALMAEIPMAELAGFLPPTQVPEGRFHLVITSDGRIVWGLNQPAPIEAAGAVLTTEMQVSRLRQSGSWQGQTRILSNDVFTTLTHVVEPDLWVLSGVASEEFDRPMQVVHSVVFGTGALLLLVSLILAYSLSKTITAPLDKLLATTQAVARGQMDITVSMTQPKELGVVADHFNIMMDELRRFHGALEFKVKSRTEQLAAANRTLLKEIEERKAVETGLKDTLASLKDAQAQLVQSAKLASIGELAAGVAHELNQPLMVIRSNGQLLKTLAEAHRLDPQTSRTVLDSIERNTKRMMDIIGHLGVFSRTDKTVKNQTDHNQLVKNALVLTQKQLEKIGISVVCDLRDGLPPVRGVPNQIEQVLVNLITNARDAIISARQRHSGDGPRPEDRLRIRTAATAEPQSGVIIWVSDTGTGIEPHIEDRIFDPFFTTKEENRGTGLGLSISYGIMEKHGGRIELAGTSAAGTTFRLFLPI